MNLTTGRVIGGLSFLVAAILIFVIALNRSGTTGCKSDWRKCANESDMLNNFDLSPIKSACKQEAAHRAKYGTPEWPQHAFALTAADTDTYRTGIVKMFEGHAKFQNVFGAMVRSRVECEYHLLAERVINLTISEW
jgi:hypothetical protein